MIENKAMQRLLVANPGAAEVDVPSRFRLLVAGGFKQLEGCFFLRALFAGSDATGLGRHIDETGFECTVNKLHLEDYLSPGAAQESAALALVGRACAWFLASRLRDYGSSLSDSPRFRVIVSVSGRTSTIRFHALRPDQSWLARNLDGYEEGILVVDSDDSIGDQ